MPIVLKFISILYFIVGCLVSDIRDGTNFILPLLIPISVVIIAEFIVCLPLIFQKNTRDVNSDFNGYQYLCSHLLLLLFTFGIWEIIWIAKTTKYINSISDKNKISVVGNILLCLFVPYYFVVWNYKVATRLDKYANDNDVLSDITAACTLLAFFDNIVVSGLIQGKINDLGYARVKKNKGTIDDADIINKLNEFSDDISFNLIVHSVLLLFTGGIWNYIWIYRTTRNLNLIDPENHRSPIANLLLSIFVPFYIIAWNYKTAKRIGKITEKVYMDSDISKTCLVFSIISSGLIAPVLIQYKLNSLSSL